MYLKKVNNKNVGPIESISIEFPFYENGNPKPVILVGENGSGKSTFLSNVIDSFYEIAGKAFLNARFHDDSINYQYYKVLSPSQINMRSNYLYSYVLYDDLTEYIFKCGDLSYDDFKTASNIDTINQATWEKNLNFKNVNVTKEKAEKIFNDNIFCFFGPDRYEKPNWMGEKYFNYSEFEHPSVNSHYSGHLENPITIKNVAGINLQWLLDLIVDSRSDILFNPDKTVSIVHLPDNNYNNLFVLGSARSKVEKIMSQILRKDVYFGLNVRNQGLSRFNIKSQENDMIVIPTLDSLSTGEIALFNIFSMIIKYADSLDINNSIHFENIKGIVVIDEIELHLHSTLQKEVLPDLLKMFPKVQFVITTHSPLFLLGMREKYGDGGFEIYQLPSGIKINTESFSEFQYAFDYMTDTQRYQYEVSEIISQAKKKKTLIITEGATDWRHIKAAYRALSLIEDNREMFENMDFELLEYDPKSDVKSSRPKLEMGNSMLCTMCESFSKIRQERKIIFIADCDDAITNNKLSCKEDRFKKWGGNVFSILLPVPQHRKSTPFICIEHYYTDDEIKTPVTIEGIVRRLYMGNEFDHHGRGIGEPIMCEKRKICGQDKISIIEGSQGERVISSSHGSEDNLALSKMAFASKILNEEQPFDQMCFDSFLELFQIIDEILKLPME